MSKNSKLSLALKVSAVALVGIPALFYSVMILGGFEKKIVYSLSRKNFPVLESIKKKTEVGKFKNVNGDELHYWHIKKDKDKIPADAPVILYCHGNEHSMSYFQNRVEFLADLGYEIFMFDYRGFGKSQGEPDEEGLYADMNSMLELLKSKYNLDPDKMVIWGHSLGGAIVADITSKIKGFKGVILEGTFTKLEDMRNFAAESRSDSEVEEQFLKVLYNSVPLTQKFETIDKIEKIKSPLILIHSKVDEVVPHHMSIELAKRNKHAKLYLSETGEHEGDKWNNSTILDFIKSLK